MLQHGSRAGNYERRGKVCVAGAPAGKHAMMTFARPPRALLRLAIMAVLAAATILPAGLATAGPLRGPHFSLGDGGGGDMRRFNLDPGPCGMAGPQFRGRDGGRGDCPGPERRLPRDGRGSLRGPGSNAFGLQFDWQGY